MKYAGKIMAAFAIASGMALGLNANNVKRFVGNNSRQVTAADTVKKVADYYPESSVVDEVIWVVGDEAILKSDVEAMRLQADAENIHFNGDPDCTIPEQIAVQKLFLHQAAIDSIEVTEAEISQAVDQQINYWIQIIGSREKLEEYRKKSILQMRQEMHDDFRDRQMIEKTRA